jgi:hypothetical protein
MVQVAEENLAFSSGQIRLQKTVKRLRRSMRLVRVRWLLRLPDLREKASVLGLLGFRHGHPAARVEFDQTTPELLFCWFRFRNVFGC